VIAALSLTAAARQLLEASTVEVTAAGLAVFCPTGTSFDAAEALRLELVAKVPTGVAVDVQIAPSLPGELSAEDEAGERLHVAERAARLAPARLEVDEEPFPWDE
jgi:enoyl-CoA hydratase/carnithine racemase